MAKAVLSKRDLELLSMIPDAKVQNKTRKNILEKKEQALARSSAAFQAHLERRKARLNAPINVEVKQSKRGRKYIVVSGGGLMESVWLTDKSAIALLGVTTQIKALIPDVTPVAVEETKPENSEE